MAMDTREQSQWQAADTLFGQWLDMDAGEREAWLAGLELDEGIRRRLEGMVAAHARPRAPLDPGASDLGGVRLGDWTLEDELGRGGMAVVYRASRQQGMARQQAAIKILTLASLGAVGRDRFQREAEILAHLGHRGITPLIDSGVTPDGTCWLAMPLVDGERIDTWIAARALDTRAVVRLFLQVCDAVAHAHRKLVIHRDLKPSNVMVDADGNPRLLDFGIARFSDSTDEHTRTMWRAMTPGFAAPEQIEGAVSSTAMDVYGLGALLHCLLTGQVPAQADDAGARASALVRDASSPQHRHHAALRRDLDRVLGKAMAHEPERRYASVDALMTDLRRWLDGHPVQAQDPGPTYRIRKFIARHKVGAVAAVLLVASLAAGLGTTLWQAREARAQAQRATLVRDFLERVFTSTKPSAEGVPTALDLLDEGAERARSEVLSKDPVAAADILLLTGHARLNLSEHEKAGDDLREALRLLQAHTPDAWDEQWRAHWLLTVISRYTGDGAANLEHARQAVAFVDRRKDAPWQEQLGTRVELGVALMGTDLAEAETTLRDVLARIPEGDPESLSTRTFALSAMVAAKSLHGSFDDEMLALAEERLRLTAESSGEESADYADALGELSNVLGHYPEQRERALELAYRSVEIGERIYQGPHVGMASPLCNLAYALSTAGRHEDAVHWFDRTMANAEAIDLRVLGMASCQYGRMRSLAALARYGAALEDYAQARAFVVEQGHGDAPFAMDACGFAASLHLRRGEPDQAMDALTACATPAEGESRDWYLARAELHRFHGEAAEALRIAEALREQHPPKDEHGGWLRPWMLSLLLADEAADDRLQAGLEAALQGHATQEPLATCLATPGEESCLAFP